VTDLYPYAPPWGSTTTWKAAKWNLDYLIRLHRPELDRAVNFAREVQFRLESIFPLMDDLCAVTCPWCPDPCCLAAKVWVDFKDLLFLHLCCLQIPPVQLLPDLKIKCRYSSPRGCTLPRITRPCLYMVSVPHPDGKSQTKDPNRAEHVQPGCSGH